MNYLEMKAYIKQMKDEFVDDPIKDVAILNLRINQAVVNCYTAMRSTIEQRKPNMEDPWKMLADKLLAEFNDKDIDRDQTLRTLHEFLYGPLPPEEPPKKPQKAPETPPVETSAPKPTPDTPKAEAPKKGKRGRKKKA